MDECLYPKGSGIGDLVGQTFAEYLALHHGMSPEEAKKFHTESRAAKKDTRREMMKHGLDPAEWERFVTEKDHHLVIEPCELTQTALGLLPGRKVIFTDGGQLWAKRMLEHLNIHHHFDLIDSFCSRGYTHKPDMVSYTRLLDELKADPKECVFFEDTETNLEPAYQLGMTTVLIHPEPPQHAYTQHHYISFIDFYHKVAESLHMKEAC